MVHVHMYAPMWHLQIISMHVYSKRLACCGACPVHHVHAYKRITYAHSHVHAHVCIPYSPVKDFTSCVHIHDAWWVCINTSICTRRLACIHSTTWCACMLAMFNWQAYTDICLSWYAQGCNLSLTHCLQAWIEWPNDVCIHVNMSSILSNCAEHARRQVVRDELSEGRRQISGLLVSFMPAYIAPVVW